MTSHSPNTVFRKMYCLRRKKSAPFWVPQHRVSENVLFEKKKISPLLCSSLTSLCDVVTNVPLSWPDWLRTQRHIMMWTKHQKGGFFLRQHIFQHLMMACMMMLSKWFIVTTCLDLGLEHRHTGARSGVGKQKGSFIGVIMESWSHCHGRYQNHWQPIIHRWECGWVLWTSGTTGFYTHKLEKQRQNCR
jgi:hypothetical protein